jgi:hypothetical protein
MLAAEGIGDVGAVAGIAYLLPRLSATDPDEFESIRSSLARLTEHDDRGPGSPVTRPEEVDASREAWRRWGLSEQSRDPKIRAVRQFVDLPEPLPERYLVEFAGDPTFDVMREGYLALRRVAGRPASDPVSTKMLPLFPRFDDGAVTRPNMRTIQERVGRWWNEWQAERRALIKAGG